MTWRGTDEPRSVETEGAAVTHLVVPSLPSFPSAPVPSVFALWPAATLLRSFRPFVTATRPTVGRSPPAPCGAMGGR